MSALFSVESLQNQAEIQEGGFGARELIPAGPKRARMFAYVEVGKEKAMAFSSEEKERYNDKVLLGFEVFYKNEAKEDKVSQVWITLNKSFTSKSKFPISFQRLNYDKKYVHMAQMAEAKHPCLLDVQVVPSKKDPNVMVNVFMDNGLLSAKPPVLHSLSEDGEMVAKAVSVPEGEMAPSVLLWLSANEAQVKSLALENREWLLKRIKGAANYLGSRVQALLEGGKAAEALTKPAVAPKAVTPSQDIDFE